MANRSFLDVERRDASELQFPSAANKAVNLSAEPESRRPSLNRQRVEVLKRRADFVETFRSGRRVKPCEWLYFNFVASGSFRAGWTVSRAVGSAVVRNKLKRWCRVWLRSKIQMSEAPSINLNIAFRPMPGEFYQRLEFKSFSAAMETGWEKLQRIAKR